MTIVCVIGKALDPPKEAAGCAAGYANIQDNRIVDTYDTVRSSSHLINVPIVAAGEK